MKTTRKLTIFFLSCFSLFCLNGNAQVTSPEEVVKGKGTDRVNTKIEEGIDEGFGKIEEGIGNIFKKKKKNKTEESEPEDGEEADEAVPDEEQPQPAATEAAPAQPALVSTTQYDFVPGDQVIYFEDFSQDAVGDFPALWTSNSGDDASNLDLSNRRAEAVKNELAKSFGIETSRMETEGAGETQPVTSNDTAENKAKNRRVELIKL